MPVEASAPTSPAAAFQPAEQLGRFRSSHDVRDTRPEKQLHRRLYQFRPAERAAATETPLLGGKPHSPVFPLQARGHTAASPATFFGRGGDQRDGEGPCETVRCKFPRVGKKS